MPLTVHVVSPNTKLLEGMHFVDVENFSGSNNIVGLNKLKERFFKSKKIAPPRESWVVLNRKPSLTPEILENPAVEPYVVVYDGSDYKALANVVESADALGAFIICVDTMDQAKEAEEMFLLYSSVDIIKRETCDDNSLFNGILVSAVVKSALREAGFLE